MEDISKFVSGALDKIGYGPEMLLIRRKWWQKYAQLENNMKFHKAGRHLILAGSKAEGVTAFYETDIDHMFILNDVLCVKASEDLDLSPRDQTVFLTDSHGSPPGYTKLKLIRSYRGRNSKLIKDSLFQDADGNKYISSSCFVAEQKRDVQTKQSKLAEKNEVSYNESSGPALPVEMSSLKADLVTGFRYQRPKELQAWTKRIRQNGWPPSDVIRDIGTRDCQAVPIGCRYTDSQFQDFRLCFIDSELELVKCLNTTQIKHYIILKQLSKNVLNSVSEEITSFIVKNVCFWLAELLHHTVFNEDRLIEIVLFSLKFLEYCVCRVNFFPYFMIPERNLIAGKMSGTERLQMSSLLDDLLKEGPRVLLRCTKIREAMVVMYKTPEQLAVYSSKRDKLEMLKLQHLCSTIARTYGVDTGESCSDLKSKMADIVLPERRLMKYDRSDVHDIVIERIHQMLS